MAGGVVVGAGGQEVELSNISLFPHLSESDRCEILPYITKRQPKTSPGGVRITNGPGKTSWKSEFDKTASDC